MSTRSRSVVAIGLAVLTGLAIARADSITPQIGGGIQYGFDGGVSYQHSGVSPTGNDLLLSDGSSFLLLSDGSSKLCLASGC